MASHPPQGSLSPAPLAMSPPQAQAQAQPQAADQTQIQSLTQPPSEPCLKAAPAAEETTQGQSLAESPSRSVTGPLEVLPKVLAQVLLGSVDAPKLSIGRPENSSVVAEGEDAMDGIDVGESRNMMREEKKLERKDAPEPSAGCLESSPVVANRGDAMDRIDVGESQKGMREEEKEKIKEKAEIKDAPKLSIGRGVNSSGVNGGEDATDGIDVGESRKEMQEEEKAEIEEKKEIKEDVQSMGKADASISSGSVLPPLKAVRVEIDTAAPFESVKEAVSLFGEHADWRGQLKTQNLDMERRVISEDDILKAQEDLVRAKEQLAIVEASTEESLAELENAKKLIALTLEEDAKVKGQRLTDDDDKAKEVESQLIRSKRDEIAMELKGLKKEIELAKNELNLLFDSKKAAIKLAEEASAAFNAANKQCEELAKELDMANGDLTAARAVHDSVEEEIAALRMQANNVESAEIAASLINVDPTPVNVDPNELKEKLANITDTEYELTDASCLVEKLKKEISEVEDSQQRTSLAIAETEQDLEKVNSELSQVKAIDSNKGILDLTVVCTEVEEELTRVTSELNRVTSELTPISESTELLRLELAKEKEELKVMHEKEQSACARLAELQEELVKLREELVRARAGEAMAKEAKETLPTAIKQAALQADEAKLAMEAAKEEVRRARHEAEEAKAATSTAQSRLQAALKEAEAARASEAMAIAEYNALMGSEVKPIESDSEPERGIGVTLSLEEYSLLNQKAKEAEELANSLVSSALDEVEKAKLSQKEAQQKLEEATKELEACKKINEEALKKAEDAQAAKLAAEGELRKWRAEHEQRRKSGNLHSGPLSMAGTPQSPRNYVPKPVVGEKHFPPPSQVDPLTQVLSLRVPSSAPLHVPPKPPAEETVKEKVKKKALLARMTAFLTKKSKKH